MLEQNEILKIFEEVYKEVNMAIDEGNDPFAAVLVDDTGNIAVQAHNQANTKNDPTAHAEIHLIQLAAEKLQVKKFPSYSVFINSEPCAMCASALTRVKVKTVYFGATQEKGANPAIRAAEIFSKANTTIEVYSGFEKERFQEQIQRGRQVVEHITREFKEET